MFALLCEAPGLPNGRPAAMLLLAAERVLPSPLALSPAGSSAPTSSAESPEHLAEPDCSHKKAEKSFALSNENIQGRNITKQCFFSYLANCLYKILLGFCVSYQFIFNSISIKKYREIRLFKLGFLHDQVQDTKALLTMKTPYISTP